MIHSRLLLGGTHLAATLLLAAVPLLVQPTSASQLQCPVRTIHQFPEPSWLENLAVMQNGSILATEMTQPRLWLVDPSPAAAAATTSAGPVLVAEFAGYLGALGIAEIEPDVFAVVTGNFSLETVESYPGTYSVWRVDMSGGGGHRNTSSSSSTGTTAAAAISKIGDVPQASFLNGIAFLGPEQNALLHADSTLGVVFRQDLRTGATTVAIDDPLMKRCTPGALEGINGLKVAGAHAYFSNAYCGLLARVPIRPDGSARGPAAVLAASDAPGTYIFDDLAVDARDGTLYAAAGNENVIARVPAGGGAAHDIAGGLNSTEIAEPTALAFGRGPGAEGTLYITTGGALGDPINGTVVVGGQLLALDLGACTA